MTEETTSDLAIENISINTSSLTINDKTVAAGLAIQFLVSGQLKEHSPYTLKITVTTDATPAQTKIGYVKFLAEA